MQDGRERAADRAGFVRVIGDPLHHQERAQVRIAQPQRPIEVGFLRDRLGGELRHRDRNLQRDRPEPHGMPVGFDVKVPRGRIVKFQHVDGGQVAGGVVQEHVLAAGVRRVDAAVRRAGVPVVDDRVELDAGIGAGPGGETNLVPEFFGFDGLIGLGIAVFLGGLGFFRAPEHRPFPVRQERFHKSVRNAHRIVGILSRDRDVGLRGPVRVVLVELDLRHALGRELQDPLDVAGWDHRGVGRANGGGQARVFLAVQLLRDFRPGMDGFNDLV